MYYRAIPLLAALVGCSAPASRTTASKAPEPTPAANTANDTAKRLVPKGKGFLLVADAQGKPLLRTDESRCAQPLRPFSTFKIANSLIGVETGILEGADATLTWSRETYPPQEWWPKAWTDREHTLRSAFRYSHVPFYRTLATHVGGERMQAWIAKFEYGNQNISGGLDSFWLTGELAISADEQVEFLRRFYEEKLGVSPHTTSVVKEIFVRERMGDSVMSAKTGTGQLSDGTALAWLVGYVEHQGAVRYFALNIDAASTDAVSPKWRISSVLAVMAELGAWPKP